MRFCFPAGAFEESDPRHDLEGQELEGVLCCYKLDDHVRVSLTFEGVPGDVFVSFPSKYLMA